jgi:hypothetical protein
MNDIAKLYTQREKFFQQTRQQLKRDRRLPGFTNYTYSQNTCNELRLRMSHQLLNLGVATMIQ